jgi:hypothetical protein
MNQEDKLPYAKFFWELRVCERARELQPMIRRADEFCPDSSNTQLRDPAIEFFLPNPLCNETLNIKL